jgi:hypothetical protein
MRYVSGMYCILESLCIVHGCCGLLAHTYRVLEGSTAQQFEAFLDGFHRVCGGPALGLLSPSELELLVAGLPHLDFAALKAGARVSGSND